MEVNRIKLWEQDQEAVAELLGQFPDATVHGHREFANKACPCFDVQAEFGKR